MLMTPPELILPPGVSLPKPVRPTEAEDIPIEQRARQLPVPTGYKLLAVVPDVTETFEGSSIIKADTFMKQEEYATTVLFVLALGPDAYKDAAKFPTGAWCKVGDFVLVRTYSGTRFKMYGKEFRILNDDMVECTVDDPRGISRA